MKWGALIGITLIVGVIVLVESIKLKTTQKKERNTLILLATLGWMLAVLLTIFPDLSGPTQIVDRVYKPLGRLLE